MTANYNLNGTDLDSFFAPYHAGWPEAAATNIKVGGVDVDGRYAAIVSGNAGPATTFKANSVDLSAIFAAAGSTSVQVATQPSNVSGSSAAGRPSGTVTSNTTTVAGRKGGGSYTYTVHVTITVGSGVTATAPSSATSGVTGSVPAGQTYQGTMYWNISDGVTNVNTSPCNWSLRNTSPGSANFSITAGQLVNPPLAQTGYESGSFGSGSSLTLPDGKVVFGLYDFTNTDGVDGAFLVISGFTSDPGANYFSSIVCNGKTRTPSDPNARYIGYGSGFATWQWALNGSTSEMFGFVSGEAYAATLNY